MRGRTSKEEKWAPHVDAHGIEWALEVTRARREAQASNVPKISGKQSWAAIHSLGTLEASTVRRMVPIGGDVVGAKWCNRRHRTVCEYPHAMEARLVNSISVIVLEPARTL